MDQEEAVRRKLVAQGYIQPYGTSDDEIRRNLGIRGKCADFVGYHLGLDRWLVGESKGSDLVTAEEQLANTLIGLLAKEPASSGKIDLQIHIRGEQFDKLPNEGLSGYHLQSNDNFLGHYNEEDIWQYSEAFGIRIMAIREG